MQIEKSLINDRPRSQMYLENLVFQLNIILQ